VITAVFTASLSVQPFSLFIISVCSVLRLSSGMRESLSRGPRDDYPWRRAFIPSAEEIFIANTVPLDIERPLRARGVTAVSMIGWMLRQFAASTGAGRGNSRQAETKNLPDCAAHWCSHSTAR
jgi:hypothetical protein